MKNLPARLMVILFVISSYVYFLQPGISNSNFIRAPSSHYLYLTEGFLSGHLSLSLKPPTALLNLPDPYNPVQNAAYRLHDASLYQDKYFLYFGPLPVFAFFMPFKLLTGVYPPEQLAVLFFVSIGFLILFLLLIKIRDTYFTNVSELQLLFLSLVIGFTNNAPFLLARAKFYEVAISSAFCFMSLAIFSLYQFFSHQYRVRDMLLFSLCLALAVAGRPHFALVCFAMIPAMTIYLRKCVPTNRFSVYFAVLFLPAAVVGTLLGVYNYLRFGSFLEFGLAYQLGVINFNHTGAFDIGSFYLHVLPGLFYYFFQPYIIHGYPLIPLVKHSIYEFTSGILTTTPFVIFLYALPKLLRFYFVNESSAMRPLLWFTAFTAIVPVVNILFLISVSYTAQRYEMDFAPYLILLSIISLWLVEKRQTRAQWTGMASKVFFAMAIMSILIGVDLTTVAH